MFPNKNACFGSPDDERPGEDSVKEKLLVGFMSGLCQMLVSGWRRATLSFGATTAVG